MSIVLGGRAGLRLLLVFLLMIVASGRVAANGGTIQVSDYRSGPYDLTVFTSSSPIVVGIVDVSVAVQRAGTSDIVQDATVWVRAEPVDHAGQAGEFPATHELATNKLFYAANVELATPGQWRLDVRVESPLGEGSTQFEVEVAEPTLLDSPLLWAALALPLVLAGGWWLASARRQRSR